MLSIIPARGGSKGIPNKNIIDINGKPLIAYTIEPALKAKKAGLIDRLIVSTDSEEIAEIARNYGAEVPFLRPHSISGDNSKSVDFVQHALSFFKKEESSYDNVLILQPTSPLRDLEDISRAISIYNGSNNDSLISVYEEEYINDLVIYNIEKDGKTSIPLNQNHNKGIRRQEHGSTYVRNGCIYISSSKLIFEGFIIGEKPLLYIMDKSKSVNIDTLEDIKLLKLML